MLEPAQPPVTLRKVTITCFTCDKDMTLSLKPWELEKKISCPVCFGKQAIISSSSL